MIDKIIFGKKLYELRTRCGMSQNRVAQILNVSYQAVSKWENGQSLPDIELLLPIAGLFGVSIESLLNADAPVDNAGIIQNIIHTYEMSEDDSRVMSVLNNYLTRDDALLALKMMESGELDIDINLEVHKNSDGKTETISKIIPAGKLKTDTLSEFSVPLAQLVVKALNKTDYILKDLVPLLRCPWCGKDLKLIRDNDDENSLLCENKHSFRIINGVIDFGSREDEGNSWSEIFRTYEDYIKKMKSPLRKPDDKNSESYKFFMLVLDELKKAKPKIIFEIGSGVAGAAEEILKYIDWPCTYILNDISFRVLEYDKRFFDNNVYNPNVKLLYIACDARILPFKDNVLDCVVSFGGYINIIENMIKAIKESYRVLKDNTKCMYDMFFVHDLNNKSTQKWIDLMKSTGWRDIEYIIEKIQEKNFWYKVNKDIGFKDFTITEVGKELPAPDTDVFPYENEILKWMGNGIIISTK